MLIVQFEDPNFGNELCNLTSMSDLPEERATLRIFQKHVPEPSNEQEPSNDDQISDSTLDTLDTASLPSTSSGDSTPRRSGCLPDPFVIPKFPTDIELKLKRGNDAYFKDGSLLEVPRSMSSDILDSLAEAIFAIKTHPTHGECAIVAKALVDKFPCLKEAGSTCGWYAWRYSIYFKVELSVHKRGRSASADTRRPKKAMRSEVNFLPEPPQNRSLEMLEQDRRNLESEMMKRNVDWKKVDALMDSTFSLRRKEIVGEEPLVKDLKARWSALFTQRQIEAEFRRIVSMNLKQPFLDRLDEFVPRFLRLYKQRLEKVKELQPFVESLDDDNSNQQKRAVVLLGLAHFLKEDPSQFFKICKPNEESEAVKGMNVGILVVTEEDPQRPVPKEMIDIALILEEHIVLRDLKDVPNAFVLLMGLLYVFNIHYPKGLKYMFEVIQKVIMNIGGDLCSSRVNGLRNKLMSKSL
ncbi:hypothetical protein PFLUV_G00015480 [Perca fluviatilis]|uniref:Uncharacterized protein n=1 Tax=Perca fluviatilis TaxID=8168 RepID=A0A6A5FDM9_PERFL|nr:uncharacterized protein LOC120571154 [Perca fluviatilis]XP_039675828.1 uncharacterized protein LOC120571154 [Perca fluviatilis]XP_039675835.1 uncharacterized protein LOC120571154 [Perca fluviatilis]XP_039675844.1 uncharacterized protein LOC120571154 [Perca fluviatilis]XP_039675852.1 uncharacterized protein LOC120571154 [Perca fluviatilis]KAF1393416.1 hypothetical protein PFLUV_G00015480 [Perca fluviatilis]